MTASDLHDSLLRPAVLQILKAAGFTFAKAAVIDTITDCTARYISLLASYTADNAFNNHGDRIPTIQDVRVAMSDLGALRPQMDTSEEAAHGLEEVDGKILPFEDLRGVQAFIEWAQGPVNKDIRRVAGFGTEIDVADIAAGIDEKEDYLTAIKKKHSKTGEESRYQGTILGKDNDSQSITIAGGPVGKLSDWRASSKNLALTEAGESPATSGISSAPLTPAEASSPDQG